MPDKEFETPPTVDVNKLAEAVSKKTAEEILKKQTPAAQPTALTEKTIEEKKEDPTAYRKKLVEIFREEGRTQKDLRETIGAASGGGMTAWAADVFHCCPYPASAFWDAPFVKWHEDIHGRPGGTLTVTTVGRATCGTAGCAEPASTAPTISTTNITMEEYQCSVYICRDDLEDMLEDTLVEINNALAECIDICIDNAFIANIGTRGGGSLVYAAGTMSAAMIAEAMGSMRNGNRYKLKMQFLQSEID